MTTSSQFTDQTDTAGLISYPASMDFTYGKIMEDPSNQTNSMSLDSNTATEVEYNFQMTDYATQDAYCFRASKAGIDFDSYDKVAELTVVHPPIIENDLTINSALNITLQEATSTYVYATSTVSDGNGYTDMILGTSTIYRSGVAGGPDCTPDPNNCYQVGASKCTFTNCSGNSCTLSCRADMIYFSDPTDSGTYAGDNWLARLSVEDSTGLRDTATTLGVEVNTLHALAVTTGPLDFGSLEPGANTGTINATTTARNTGNAPIDIQVQGTDLSGTTGTIGVGEQKYATTTFAYGSCSICQLLTGSATNVNVTVAKPTSTSTAQTHDIYFGIDIPIGSPAETYTGINTFTAVSP